MFKVLVSTISKQHSRNNKWRMSRHERNLPRALIKHMFSWLLVCSGVAYLLYVSPRSPAMDALEYHFAAWACTGMAPSCSE